MLRGKPFSFSSLGQQVQFGVLKFCRTFGRTILVFSGVSNNKPGTAQVGFISKAQKYSRNNNWKNLEKLFFLSKKYLVEKSRIFLKNPKRDPLGLLNVFFCKPKTSKNSIERFFYKPKTSKNSRGYPLIEFTNFRKNA